MEKQFGKLKHPIFAPIIDFSLADVWETIHSIDAPDCISNQELTNLYRGASGECPVIKSPISPPCASGRFGCWTCTVVRQDKSARKLIESGYEELKPFLEFRNWIGEIRNDPNRRWVHRRNGVPRPGPFSISARVEILKRLLQLERKTNSQIICEEEALEIERLWHLDRDIDPTVPPKISTLKLSTPDT